MDSVTRQTSQHLEFEPEWEGAFNLQLRLEDSLVLFADWCSADVSAWSFTQIFGFLFSIFGGKTLETQ
jgi:E3 ubiquitin-protein ligase UBR2